MIHHRKTIAAAGIAAASVAGALSVVPALANNSDCRLRRARVKRRGAGLLSIALFAAALHPAPAYAAENDAVNVWNQRAIVTLVNGPAAASPGVQFTPPVAFIHLAIVQGAVYDAVNAIKGGHDPYLAGLKAPTSASKGAAAVGPLTSVTMALSFHTRTASFSAA